MCTACKRPTHHHSPCSHTLATAADSDCGQRQSQQERLHPALVHEHSMQALYTPSQLMLTPWQLLQIATVDKYQGQQNDYILLSLVRTRAVGHIRDVRRLVVAMSRARLGLYIFGRAELFANCYELRPTMKQLLARPQQLHLHPSERLAVSKPLSIGQWILNIIQCYHKCPL